MKSLAKLIPELSAWNNGRGIDVESWISCMGSSDLAIGYSTVFWPAFTSHKDYILRDGFSPKSLNGFEERCGNDMRGIECVMNHLHIRDIHHTGDQTINAAKARYLGTILKEIHEVKLAHDFPDRPCTVDLFIPEDEDDLTAYSLTFWQKKHEFQRVEQGADGKTPYAAQPPH